MTKNLSRISTVSGLVAFVCFLLTPLLPVNQVQSSLSWPQNGSLSSVNAPLISLAPDKLETTVPIRASIDALRSDETLIMGTLPESSPEASDRGLFISSNDGGLVVTSLNEVLLELTPSEVRSLPADAELTVTANSDGISAEIPGTDFSDDTEDDLRPQVTGIYTELEGNEQSLVDAGLNVSVDINSRFTSTPSVIKILAMVLGSIATIVSLWALWRLDGRDGKHIPFFRREWRTFKPLDGIVVAVLGFWHIFGANTSDDGYLLSMARVANESDYMANYYRWYGVPESPFGSPYYDILSVLAQVSTASMWMRLPALVAGLLTWWILSREILPRLGEVVSNTKVAYWTAAFVFLAFWLPYNNGARPEPIIALGVIATWACFERAIDTNRLFPAALGTIFAAFTLACGPTGLAAVGVFLVSLPAIFRMMPKLSLAYIAPFLAAGFAVMIAVFHDQTLATVVEATKVRSEVGPALPWYSEWVRYGTLFQQTVDGSMTRRFPMFVFLFSVGMILWVVFHRGTISDATRRLLLIIGLSTFFLMFTPTKWTHHFGIYAGIGAAAAAVGAVVLAQLATSSARNRTLVLAAVAFLMSITLAGWNGWWYVSSFGVPWWDKTVQYKTVEASTVVLVITLVIFITGIVQWLRGKTQPVKANILTAPIAVVSVLMVAFSCLTFLKAFIDQAPAYSVGMGNVHSFAGNHCALGSDVLLESNTNDSFLSPVDGSSLGDSLDSGDNRGFSPDGVPSFIIPEDMESATADARTDDDDNATASTLDADSTATADSGTQGNRSASQKGVNDSTVRLPFNLDYNEIPVLGSYDSSATGSARLETTWFDLPEATDDAPLVVATVAGRISHDDINGVEQPGTDLKLEYGTKRDDGSVDTLGDVVMLDHGPTPSWRNIRYPIADLPKEANAVRLVGEDNSLADRDWMAVTPLRVPTLTPLDDVFSSDTPGLLDWSVALQYPCQRTFSHYAGVAEIPQFRIMPDAPGKAQLSGFMDFIGGGALSTAEAVNYAYDIPGYLASDWARDWGSVSKYVPRTNSEGDVPELAQIDNDVVSRSGWWSPGPMKIRDPDEFTD